MCFIYFFGGLFVFDLFVILVMSLYSKWYKKKYGIYPEYSEYKTPEPWPEDYPS